MDRQPLTKGQIVDRLRAIRSQIEELGVRRLALFGSTVRGQAHAASDIDLLVQFDPERKTLRTFMALAFLLEDTLERRVELVTTESLSPLIGPHILREAEDVLHAA
jgi:predicted nucleotidyltransferase